MNAVERRWAILTALCARRQETRGNFANEFGVCKRTIDYDVFCLSLKYPIYTVRGYGGGIRVVDGFRLDRPGMNEKQLGLLNRLLCRLDGEDEIIMRQIIAIYGGIKTKEPNAAL